MPSARTPYDAVLHAARDLPKVDTALDAELLGATLLGSVYSLAESDRAGAVRAFVGDFLAHTARRRTTAARTLRYVFAALVPDAAGASAVSPGADPPSWASQVGRVRPVGAWAYGDVYGDQTSYLALFAYDEPRAGGPEHAVMALVDHNIGIVKDLFVGWPGERVLDEVRRTAAEDDLIWFSEVDPGRLRHLVLPYLDVTDGLAALPNEGSLATDRALAGARLRALPDEGPAATAPPCDRGALVDEFLASAPGAALDPSLPSSAVAYALRLICDFAEEAPDADPTRWSPTVAGLFLLDWVHRRAVLDDEDARTLPAVVRAWVRWAGERRNLPPAAVAGTVEAVDAMTEEFTRVYRSGERRGPAVEAVATLLAEGVDPSDPEAVRRWLADRPSGNGHHSS